MRYPALALTLTLNVSSTWTIRKGAHNGKTLRNSIVLPLYSQHEYELVLNRDDLGPHNMRLTEVEITFDELISLPFQLLRAPIKGSVLPNKT